MNKHLSDAQIGKQHYITEAAEWEIVWLRLEAGRLVKVAGAKAQMRKMSRSEMARNTEEIASGNITGGLNLKELGFSLAISNRILIVRIL